MCLVVAKKIHFYLDNTAVFKCTCNAGVCLCVVAFLKLPGYSVVLNFITFDRIRTVLYCFTAVLEQVSIRVLLLVVRRAVLITKSLVYLNAAVRRDLNSQLTQSLASVYRLNCIFHFVSISVACREWTVVRCKAIQMLPVVHFDRIRLFRFVGKVFNITLHV